MIRRAALVWFLAFCLIPMACFARDANWAKPVVLDGVPNLNQVAPNLYRSAQPTAAGFQALEKSLNIKADLDLRDYHSDANFLTGTKITPLNVPMNALHITTDEIVAALKLIKAKQAEGPILVHCQHGADRTGVVIAMYRIIYQGWSKAQAIDEMEHGGFNFHSIFFNIPAFINNADINQIKAALAKA